ncbi:MAG: restriction endonuclease subunit S [Bryobacterales bacterium]|nr:restriction endonuclease subunit S [Bryobacterales bacterium]
MEHVESWTGCFSSEATGIDPASSVKQFKADDVLFGKLRPYLAKVIHPRKCGVCVGEFLVLRSQVRILSAGYLSRLLRSKQAIDAIDASTFGAKMPRAEWNFIGRLKCPLPPLSEQAAIARYLDRADERIQHSTEAKEKLVGLLQEMQKALINEAVTGRFDVRTGQPYPTYKPSGVEWLGEVPAHWEVRRLKATVSNVVNLTTSRRSGEMYLALEHVESWTGCFSSEATGIDPASSVKQFKADDVLFGKLRPYLAKVIHPRKCGVCVGEFLVLRSQVRILSAGYLSRLLRSKQAIDAIDASTFGAKMPRAEWNFIGRLKCPLPPLSEQAAIARYLDRADERIQHSIQSARRQIDLLNEYRARLIADVVTGKLDVRQVAAEMAGDTEKPESVY